MSARVDGYGGIRETYEVNPDGSVTTLRTRLGWPAFETDSAKTSVAAPTVPERGFVAKVPGGRAVLFNPYTMAVLKSPYLPAINSYSVQDFGTTWNVAPADTTNWYDVVLFDGTTIKVNSKAMPSLRITANHGFPAIPYVINRDTADDQYGNAERNATEKRVFAVGRYSVKSWGGGGIVETLTPTEPRTEDRCLTIGQRTDRATNTAWIGQLYHGIDGWDGATDWYFRGASVQMLLTSAYLVKTSLGANVAMSPPTLSSAGTSSGTPTLTVLFPPTHVGMTATATVEAYVNWQASTLGFVRWYWSAPISQPLYGATSQSFTKGDYAGSATSSEVQAGWTLDYSASNQKYWKDISETSRITPQTVTLGGSGYSDTDRILDATISTLYWEDLFYPPASIPATRGVVNRVWSDNITIADSAVSRQEQVQTGSFTIMLGSELLVSVTFSKNKMTGNQLVMTPNTHYYDIYIGNDAWSGGGGMGYGAGCYVRLGSNINYYNNPTGVYASQPAGSISAINSEAAAMSDAMAASVYYDSEASSGTYMRENFYLPSISVLDTVTSTLDWSTKDYILHDTVNGVLINVESTFSGVYATATLNVMIRVKTRHHDTTQTLGTYSYSYGSPDGMLPEREIGSTGKYAVPSPQIRAIFAPLYQEQGSFKGAHYVTLAEESNGATPFHGFNFLLYLRPYSSLNTCNADNETGQAVYFVPCNLLEMLYAFVFSSDLGVAEDGTRYPVTHSANFTALMSTLFSNPVRVSVRNGTVGGWTDALGSDFASVSTVSLHRA